MVGGFYVVVDIAGVWAPVFGAHDIVNAHIEAIVMIAYAGTIGGACVAVGEQAGYGVVGVGYWRVVEVAGEYQTLVFVKVYVFCHGIGLWCT